MARVIPCDRLVDFLGPGTDFPYRIELGEVVEVEVADCYGGFPGRGQPGAGLRPNPVTGPIAVAGIKPGDTIAVEIRAAQPVGDGFIGGRDDRTWMKIDAAARTIMHPAGPVIPLSPCIGTIGVTPADEPVATVLAGDHGGNMDCNIIGPGATVCFLARVAEAGLGMGDVHAAMGDGEVSGQGLEVAARIQIAVRRVAGLGLPCPYGLRGARFFVIGWGTSLEAAAESAAENMTTALSELCDFDRDTAFRLLGLAADLHFGWATGQRPTVWIDVDISILPQAAREKLHESLSAI